MLDRKLLRDLRGLAGQVLTIALLIGSGVAVLVMSVSAWLSLREAQRVHYTDSRFAEVFTAVKRAPAAVLPQIAAIQGVAVVEGRIVGDVRVDWPASATPVAGRMHALPPAGAEPVLNRLTLRNGRWPDPTRREEAIMHAAFAEAWNLHPGDTLVVILNGRREEFRVVGTAHSPEYVFAARPGNPLPDDRGFVVLWAGHDAMANAFDMQGAFNHFALSLAPGASEPAVIAELDRMLTPWGSLGAFGRRDQPSHRFLEDELAEQRTLAVSVPLLFFGIAAFLLNVVLGRMVEAQREQVAALKALGYPSWPIALHYAKFVAVVCVLGSLLGIAAGAWMGTGMLANYRPFFRFPDMPFVLPAWLPLLGVVGSFAAALAGVLAALHRTLRLPAGEGLRPPAPAAFGGGRLGLVNRSWAPRTKLVLRGLLGRPLRTGLTILGLALAVPMVVLGLFWWDALNLMVERQFDGIERGDALVAFTDPRSARAEREIARLPGVLATEGLRIVPVRLRAGHRTHLLGLTGLPAGAELRVPRDEAMRAIPLPPRGLAMSRRLAEKLAIGPGAVVQVEVLEGARRRYDLPVVALVDDVIGLSVYMERASLNRLLREDDLVSHVVLRVDPLEAPALWRHLSDRPRVAVTMVKSVWLRVIDDVVAGVVLASAVVLTGFGIIIAVGIVYNNARVALQERGWEMASLRVLGFTRAEVTLVLLAELAVSIVIAAMLGVPLAHVLVTLLLSLRDNESFSLPVEISSGTYAMAELVVLTAAAASAVVVRQRIERLDLVGALKARE